MLPKVLNNLCDFMCILGIAISGGSSGFFGCALSGAIAESTQTLARSVGCRRLNGSEEIVDCLREVDANELDFWGLVGVITFRLVFL